MTDGWQDLSGVELRARLVQRGVPVETANRLVADRDRSPEARKQIAERLKDVASPLSHPLGTVD